MGTPDMVYDVVEQIHLQHHQKGKESHIIVTAYAVAYPGAVMVVDADTAPTSSTVARSNWPDYLCHL